MSRICDFFNQNQRILNKQIYVNCWVPSTFILFDCSWAKPYQKGFQKPVAPVMEGIIDFHHDLMFFLMFILGFVLFFLSMIAIIFMNVKSPNKEPYKITSVNSHSAILEMIWTMLPGLILFSIILPSFALIYSMDEFFLHPRLTIKAIGNQWYWTYNYGVSGFISNNSFVKTPAATDRPSGTVVRIRNTPEKPPLGFGGQMRAFARTILASGVFIAKGLRGLCLLPTELVVPSPVQVELEKPFQLLKKPIETRLSLFTTPLLQRLFLEGKDVSVIKFLNKFIDMREHARLRSREDLAEKDLSSLETSISLRNEIDQLYLHLREQLAYYSAFLEAQEEAIAIVESYLNGQEKNFLVDSENLHVYERELSYWADLPITSNLELKTLQDASIRKHVMQDVKIDLNNLHISPMIWYDNDYSCPLVRYSKDIVAGCSFDEKAEAFTHQSQSFVSEHSQSFVPVSIEPDSSFKSKFTSVDTPYEVINPDSDLWLQPLDILFFTNSTKKVYIVPFNSQVLFNDENRKAICNSLDFSLPRDLASLHSKLAELEKLKTPECIDLEKLKVAEIQVSYHYWLVLRCASRVTKIYDLDKNTATLFVNDKAELPIKNEEVPPVAKKKCPFSHSSTVETFVVQGSSPCSKRFFDDPAYHAMKDGSDNIAVKRQHIDMLKNLRSRYTAVEKALFVFNAAWNKGLIDAVKIEKILGQNAQSDDLHSSNAPNTPPKSRPDHFVMPSILEKWERPHVKKVPRDEQIRRSIQEQMKRTRVQVVPQQKVVKSLKRIRQSNNLHFKFDSYMVPDEMLSDSRLRLLEVDKQVCLPYLSGIRLLVSSYDVLHSWAVPALGIKLDGCPGRLNQTFLFIKQTGTFYGQCSEICGVNHGFMPIAVRVILPEEFNQWLSQQVVLFQLFTDSAGNRLFY